MRKVPTLQQRMVENSSTVAWPTAPSSWVMLTRKIKRAITGQAGEGLVVWHANTSRTKFARLITGDHPGMDMVRFVSSGSEATMAAIRLARGFTGKSDIIKIEGGFHGAHDGVLVKAGSGATTMGVPDSAGVPRSVVAHTGSCLTMMQKRSKRCSHGITTSPLSSSNRVLGISAGTPRKTVTLRISGRSPRRTASFLIFDEVITGYRLGIGGAQVLFGVKPDLTTLGKIVGGGLPIGAFCGRREIMALVAPQGPVYQAGTFWGILFLLPPGLQPSAGCTIIPVSIRSSTGRPGRLLNQLIKTEGRLCGLDRC